ncbi:hypothetical protein BKA82DRAFT_1005750 [Pisolithus tinctorius]|uniref:Uncharacterized protein n=1 Tax=Pisolithus tinctorius Marx 270 TaxID=870435 RepID=A0A0C3NQW9_PISTI|nr:hypothetical protein BKA82DRAFT_1005750 [Pisolithus tinctorius]KIN97900.1 hypothetical protein M404DRAFT_1005750 [Pisolithus tinctorius Marx 270]
MSDGMICIPQCGCDRGRSQRGPVLHPSPSCCIATAVHSSPRKGCLDWKDRDSENV